MNLSQYTGVNLDSPSKRKTAFCYADFIYKNTENSNLKKYYFQLQGNFYTIINQKRKKKFNKCIILLDALLRKR